MTLAQTLPAGGLTKATGNRFGKAGQLSSASVPRSLRAAVEASQAQYLLITAGDVSDEGRAAAFITAAAAGRSETWTVPGTGHTDGLRTEPGEWERRVVAFLTGALGVEQ